METASLAARPPERELYQKLWETEDYRAISPGEECVAIFLKQARPRMGSTVLDIGCGTGRASLLMALPPPMGANLKVTMIDFTDNCLDPDIKDMLVTQPHALKFVQADITKEITARAIYGFCADVMEHIPPERVDRVLNVCLMSCQHVFFQISTQVDNCGKLVGHPLHLSVHSYAWWLQKFKERECIVYWSAEADGFCMFYVSAWTEGKIIQDVGTLNIEEEKAKNNVQYNIRQGWMQVEPHDTILQEVMIVGGGPTLNAHLEEIRQKRREGVKLITLNGAYNWALDHGLTPSATVIVDARPHNARFTKPVVDNCRYLICSQCDPTVFEGLPKDRTYLWHTSVENNYPILNEFYDRRWWWIPGGSTVLLRSIPLLRLLGYKRFHLYGCDSCVVEAEHHAYLQKENDGEALFPTTVSTGDRIFMTTIWQAAQAHEFVEIIKFLGDEIELQIYGDGLLAYILRTGAELSTEEEE